MERAVFSFGLLNPVAALPQAYNVWVLGQTSGFSRVSVGSALGMALLWVGYGFVNRKRAVWVINGVWATYDAAMLAGLMLRH
jgi:hypothetical protein